MKFLPIYILSVSVVGCWPYTPPTPVELTTPTSVSTTVLPDSAALAIFIYPDSMAVALFGVRTRLQSTQGLDDYIRTNRARIDTSKVRIMNHSNAPVTTFQEVLGVLRKYNMHKFQLLTKEN